MDLVILENVRLSESSCDSSHNLAQHLYEYNFHQRLKLAFNSASILHAVWLLLGESQNAFLFENYALFCPPMSVWFMNGHFPNPNNITPARLSYSANSSCESEFVFGA